MATLNVLSCRHVAASRSEIKVAVDAVVFGYSKSEGGSVLLIQRKNPPFKNAWAIPGGFVLPEEWLEDAVRRELRRETLPEYEDQLVKVFENGRLMNEVRFEDVRERAAINQVLETA